VKLNSSVVELGGGGGGLVGDDADPVGAEAGGEGVVGRANLLLGGQGIGRRGGKGTSKGT